MTTSIENYYFSSDTGQDETEWLSVWRLNYYFSSGTGQVKTEWQRV